VFVMSVHYLAPILMRSGLYQRIPPSLEICHRFLAYVAVPFEFFGGIALIFGFATRYVVLGFVIFMLVATFSSHRYWEFADASTLPALHSKLHIWLI
jgi:uncharacterized membrane protein YphA (DoxX/SURF4 family)